jgi:lipid A 4'-phosphatase
MNRAGLIIALAVAIVVGVVFGLDPQLDLALSQPFYAVVDARHNAFALQESATLALVHVIALRGSTLLIVPAAAALVFKLILPRRKLLMSGCTIIFLVATMALGPGLLVNVALKNHWGRPRPAQVTQFGGSHHFVAWWDPRGDCPRNCSFVSGDVSSAAWTFALAAVAPLSWRALAYGGALVLSIGMASMRMMSGSHFFTDAIFAGVFTFLIIWLVHGLIYRWPLTRLSDDAIERALTRLATPGHDFIVGLFGGKRKSEP